MKRLPNRTVLLPDRKGTPPMAALPQAESIDFESLLSDYDAGRVDLVCVVGPTASGKTRYAVALCRALNRLRGVRDGEAGGAEILSADSRQVYRGMDIGTGKDLGEYGAIPFHLIDLAPAGSRFNLHLWQQAFEKAYADIRRRGGIPVLCGGTGLYVEAAVCGYRLPAPESDEIPSGWDGPLPVPKKAFYIGTLVGREERVARIDRRLDERLGLPAGAPPESPIPDGPLTLVGEIKALLAGGVAPEDLMYYGLEYKFVTQYVKGVLEAAEMRILLANAIHQFAKRQMTWFRGMERRRPDCRIHWVCP